MSDSRARIQPILVSIATVAVILINYLAATGRINKTTPELISAQNPSLITPAGYAFSIWGLIYLGLLIFSVYQMLPQNSDRLRPLRPAYLLSCATNCLWIYCWHHELLAVCAGIILVLLGSLAFINIKLKDATTKGDYWLVKFPFGLYFGWVTAATILNITVALVSLNVQLSDSTAATIGAALLFAAAALGVIICLKLKNYFYPLAIAWALTAIAVKHGEQTLLVAAAAVGVGACLIAALSFVLNPPPANVK